MWLSRFVFFQFLFDISLGIQWHLLGRSGFLYSVKFGGNTMNFTEAERYCNSFGGNLASIHSEEENQFIHDVAKVVIQGYKLRADTTIHDIGLLLFGLHRKDQRLEYTDKSQYDFSKWRKGEPSGGNEDCTVFLEGEDPNVAEWNDVVCSFPFRSHICQKLPSEEEVTVVGMTVSQIIFTVLGAAAIFVGLLAVIACFRCFSPYGRRNNLDQYASFPLTELEARNQQRCVQNKYEPDQEEEPAMSETIPEEPKSIKNKTESDEDKLHDSSKALVNNTYIKNN